MPSPHAADGARLLAEGRPEEAIRVFRTGLAASPRDMDCHLGLVRAYLSQRNLPEARKALDRLLSVDSRHLEAQSHQALLDANDGDEEAFRKLRTFSNHPEAGFFEHFNLASASLRRGDDEGAEAAYERAVKAQPKSSHAWFELGMIAERRGDHAAAIERFRNAADLAPGSHVPLYMLSRAHTARGEVGRAVEALKKAIAVAPREESLYEDLYKLCFLAGSPEGALTASKALRALDPRNGNYAYMQGMAQLTTGRVAEARDTLAQAARLSPASWEVKHALARAHQQAQDVPAAIKLLEEVRAAVPTEPGPMNDLALLYLASQDPAAAVRVLEPVLQARPDEPATHLSLALALAPLDPARASFHAEKAEATADADLAEQARKLLRKLNGG
ncbi:MAG TPA: tetratricopeptide repeat protein [Longimicrobium sp.]|nr:tetratricopeptide repeat protein [Longimicrobium sp.]